MKITGIIAEYNPFHNGHRYQLEQVRQHRNADYIVVVMNGDFMQRGEPAMINKYDRTRMALSEGADLVIELPVIYGTGSAEYFAHGSIRLLHALGCVDQICFGCEYDNLSHLSSIASVYAFEDADFKYYLNQYRKQGISYPKARTQALLQYTKLHSLNLPDDIQQYLAMPNTVLAVEYLKALQICHSDMEPYLLKRIGQDYHSSALPAQTMTETQAMTSDHIRQESEVGLYASASAIRSEYLTHGMNPTLSAALPASTGRILTDAYHINAPVTMELFYPLIQYRIWMQDRPLTDYQDITEDLANRMLAVYQPELSYTEYVDAIVNKQYTRTRIMRCLLHLLLGITHRFVTEQRALPDVPYARILGFRKESSALLRLIREQGSLSLVQKTKDALDEYTRQAPSAAELLRMDIQAAHLYEQVCHQTYHTTLHNEYTQGMIIL